MPSKLCLNAFEPQRIVNESKGCVCYQLNSKIQGQMVPSRAFLYLIARDMLRNYMPSSMQQDGMCESQAHVLIAATSITRYHKIITFKVEQPGEPILEHFVKRKPHLKRLSLVMLV